MGKNCSFINYTILVLRKISIFNRTLKHVCFDRMPRSWDSAHEIHSLVLFHQEFVLIGCHEFQDNRIIAPKIFSKGCIGWNLWIEQDKKGYMSLVHFWSVSKVKTCPGSQRPLEVKPYKICDQITIFFENHTESYLHSLQKVFTRRPLYGVKLLSISQWLTEFWENVHYCLKSRLFFFHCVGGSIEV